MCLLLGPMLQKLDVITLEYSFFLSSTIYFRRTGSFVSPKSGKTHFKNVWASCWVFVGRFLILDFFFLLVLLYSGFCFLLESMLLNYIFLGNCPFCMCFQIYWHEILHRIVF